MQKLCLFRNIYNWKRRPLIYFYGSHSLLMFIYRKERKNFKNFFDVLLTIFIYFFVSTCILNGKYTDNTYWFYLSFSLLFCFNALSNFQSKIFTGDHTKMHGIDNVSSLNFPNSLKANVHDFHFEPLSYLSLVLIWYIVRYGIRV